MSSLHKGYVGGTHRLVSPEQTFERIRPHLSGMGITRVADVTGLDVIGIPTICAIRPRGKLLQVSNGKGLRKIDAQVSALMESIEMFHAENPAVFRRSPAAALTAAGQRWVSPRDLKLVADVYYTDDFVTNWTPGIDLLSDEEVWLPASAVYWAPPKLCAWDSNGLASGNHLTEATLHALYELTERDALSELVRDDDIDFGPTDVIDLDSVDDPGLQQLMERVHRADLHLRLLRCDVAREVHTFLAILLDPCAFSHATTVNVGSGAHLSPAVAATRAITEAAQSRLTFIHAAREDLPRAAYRRPHHDAYEFFLALEPDTGWDELCDGSTATLHGDYDAVLAMLRRLGIEHIYRADLTRPDLQIPVVKVFAMGFRHRFPL